MRRVDDVGFHPVSLPPQSLLPSLTRDLPRSSIFRSIELLNGWNGPLATNQLMFELLDAMPMVMVTWLFNVMHPGRYLPASPFTRRSKRSG